MTKQLTVLIFVALLTKAAMAQVAWINEIHYANQYTDVNEFIEVVVRNSDANISQYCVYLYNGDGHVYDSTRLSNYIKGQQLGDCNIYYRRYGNIVNDNGAIALTVNIWGEDRLIDYGATGVEFWSYNGLVIAMDGPAMGYMSKDVGYIETALTPVNNSIQLYGQHFTRWGYNWAEGLQSIGRLNSQQTIDTVARMQSGWSKTADADSLCALEGHVYTGNFNYTPDSLQRVYTCIRCCKDTIVPANVSIPINPIFQ